MADPLWHTAIVAMPFNGADGSTAVVDLKGHAFTAYGDARITTADGVFGGACAVFDGTGDYLRADAVMPDAVFSYQSWSAAFWVRTAVPGKVLLDFDDTFHNALFQVLISGAGQIQIANLNGTRLTGATSIADGAWHYVVAGKAGLTSDAYFYVTVDGVLDGVVALTDYWASTNVRLAIGAQVRYRDAAKDFVGKLDDLIIRVGPTGWGHAFKVPVAAFGVEFGGVVAAVAGGVPLTFAAGSPPQPMSAKHVRSLDRLVDLENGGRGRVIGTTKNVGNPDYPVSRRVRLLRKRDGFLAREGWSDAGGNYLFEHVRHDIEYIVLSHDHTGVYNAVIADSVTPDLMP